MEVDDGFQGNEWFSTRGPLMLRNTYLLLEVMQCVSDPACGSLSALISNHVLLYTSSLSSRMLQLCD